MQARKLLFVLVSPLFFLSYHSLSIADEKVTKVVGESTSEQVEWGSWAIESGENPRMFGSGIVGNDENILHELDKSNLLDYDPQFDQLLMPDLPTSEGFATEPTLGGDQ